MAPKKPAPNMTVRELAGRLDAHDVWEKAEGERLDGRLDRMEQAVVTLNHASEKLAIWQAEVRTDLSWLKVLIGATAVAGFGQLIHSLIIGK
jgi:hypothetical protein